jgi:putative tryptophan/tyrosine transport system substrate-binding protein
MIGRRDFITLVGAAATWPFAARAQQSPMPVIGFLNAASPGPYMSNVTAFRRGLNETGFSEGRNVAIEYRWAEEHCDRLPQLAADLVHRQVAVIAATGGGLSAAAAKAATTTIPIVFVTGTDPVQQGLVASFNRPGGNVTGVFVLLSALEGKRLGLLRDMVPTATLIAVLLNPANPSFDSQLNDIQEAARSVGQQLHILYASSEHEIDAAFATAAQLPARAMLVCADVVFVAWRDQLIALAARYAMPAIFELREFAAAGGLMSYGASLSDAYRLVGLNTGQILKGAKPADLPVQQSTKFELVINLKTAKVLGINVPPTLPRSRRRGDRIGHALLHCISPVLALRDDTSSRVNSVAIGGIADLSERLVQTSSVENDPLRKSSKLKCL